MRQVLSAVPDGLSRQLQIEIGIDVESLADRAVFDSDIDTDFDGHDSSV